VCHCSWPTVLGESRAVPYFLPTANSILTASSVFRALCATSRAASRGTRRCWVTLVPQLEVSACRRHNSCMSAPDFLLNPHRKQVRHFDQPSDAHFLTFSCYQRLPLLSKDRTRKWLAESIERARTKHSFDLWAWVIMPEHVHLLIYPSDAEYNMSRILSAIKRPVGERAIAYLSDRKSTFLERLTVRTKGRIYHRFWQAGPGYDHNVYDPETAHRVVKYIHENPIRRRLVAHAVEWTWSSAADWIGQTNVPIRVDRTLPPILEFPSAK
jgi:REP-associated tyrosine transposase